MSGGRTLGDVSETEKRPVGTVSAQDKERMRRFAESCKEAEVDELVQGEDLAPLEQRP